MAWKTFQTADCPRVYPEIPYVACLCADCTAIRRLRATHLVLNAMAKRRLLYCSTCGLSLVTAVVPPTAPCEGCAGLRFSTTQRVAAWRDRVTEHDRAFLKTNRIAAS